MSAQEKLLEMLTWMRPHNSQAEKDFVEKFIVEPSLLKGLSVARVGPMENILITVGKDSSTIFSCHTDTVHSTGGLQEIMYADGFDFVFKKDGRPLGADDTTGVWLMLQMIEAEVPGFYLFHRGEECGGQGSSWIARERKDWLKQFERAIAFDRKGEDSVITRQRGRDCCSSEFAKALAAALGPEWKEDPGGTFTDTANYMSVVPECTNLSIGYYDQHTASEMQNISFAMELVPKLVAVEWEKLPTVREAKEDFFSSGYHRGGRYGGLHDYDTYFDKPRVINNPGHYHGFPANNTLSQGDADELRRSTSAITHAQNNDLHQADEDDMFDATFADILDTYLDIEPEDWAFVPLAKIKEVIEKDPAFIAGLIVDMSDQITEYGDDYAMLEKEKESLEIEVEKLNLRLKRLSPRSARFRN